LARQGGDNFVVAVCCWCEQLRTGAIIAGQNAPRRRDVIGAVFLQGDAGPVKPPGRCMSDDVVRYGLGKIDEANTFRIMSRRRNEESLRRVPSPGNTEEMASNTLQKAKAVQKVKAPRVRNARGEGERLHGEIITAAIKVLSTIGPEDPFSLRAVAKEAGIAATSVYIHFADRDVLLRAVLERLFHEQLAIRAAAEEQAAEAGGGPWERLLARSIVTVEFGLKHPGHYKALFDGRVVLRLNDPRIADFGRPLLVRSIELIRNIKPISARARVTQDPQRLALLLWSGLHGVISLRINKPTLDWPSAPELAEQIARAIIQPK
jgi:AcrR family transcriptional regulator